MQLGAKVQVLVLNLAWKCLGVFCAWDWETSFELTAPAEIWEKGRHRQEQVEEHASESTHPRKAPLGLWQCITSSKVKTWNEEPKAMAAIWYFEQQKPVFLNSDFINFLQYRMNFFLDYMQTQIKVYRKFKAYGFQKVFPDFSKSVYGKI